MICFETCKFSNNKMTKVEKRDKMIECQRHDDNNVVYRGYVIMKHIFIVNPAAGINDASNIVKSAVDNSEYSADCEIYCTKAPGDAASYVRLRCGETHEQLRFYACGGDGTLNEVVNGAAGFENAAVGCFPHGSGNDFVKYYGGVDAFMNVDDLICGEEHPIDLIKVGGDYSINVCNFGFDAEVINAMEKARKKGFLKGQAAYYFGVLKSLVTSMRTPCQITVDGKELNADTILLCSIANGQYYGSTFRCAPRSRDDDGLLEVCVVKPISRLRFVKMMGSYTRGEHLDEPKFKDVILYSRGKNIRVRGTGEFTYIMDGEMKFSNDFTVEVAEKALHFIIPRGASPIVKEEKAVAAI